MINYKLLTNAIDFIVVFIIVLIPILINPYALWDGAVLNYSSAISYPDILVSVFTEAGAPLAALLNLTVYYVSSLSGIESKTVYSLSISLFTLLLYSEVIKIISLRFSLAPLDRGGIAFLFSVLPFWSSFLADIYINYVFFILCAVASVNLLLRKRYVLSFFVGVISLTLKINIYFHPLLFLLIFLFPEGKEQLPRSRMQPIIHFYALFLLCFILQEIFIKPYGSYAGYNSFEMSKIWEFFFDPKVYFKLAFLVPVLLIFSLSKDRLWFSLFTMLSIGFVGIFYITNKFSYISILDFSSFTDIHPYVLRLDISFYLFLFVLSVLFFLSVKSTAVKLAFMIAYFAFFLPQRYFADFKMSGMVSNIESVYNFFEKNKKLVGKTGLINSRIQGTSVANYHYYKIFGDTQKISVRALNSAYQTDFCTDSAPLVYKKKGICNEFKDWETIYNPAIPYSGYSVKDLWLR